MRPLVAVKFRRMRHRSKPVALLDVEKTGPASSLVTALDGLPIARELRIIIDRLFGSSSLPPRTVSILFAVVARALGSLPCEVEATRLLLDEGMAQGDVDQVLTHLSSPALSELEQILVPLARETVWYQPAQIQRRCAEVQAQLSKAQFLDFCGAVALLNSVCRLGVIVDMRAA